MSAREWIPPEIRFVSDDLEQDLWLEMKASWALEDVWKSCMLIHSDGDEYEIVWRGFMVMTYRVPKNE